MNYLTALLLSLALFAPPAQAASFDCAKAGTEIERMICGDAELSALDGLLGDRYVRARVKGADPKAIKTDQRAWLRDTRNPCTDATCVKAAYEARIAELTKIGWMTEEKAAAICERVAAAKVDGSYHGAFRETGPDEEIVIDPTPGLQGYRGPLNVDYDGDGKVEKLGEIGLNGGSCPQPVSVITDVTAGEPEHNPVHDLNWQEGTQVFMVVDGEPTLARTPNDPRSVLQLAWLTPSGGEAPLCSISIKHERRLKTVKSENPALCNAVAATSTNFLPWEQTLDQAPEKLRKINRPIYINDMSRLVVDLDLDGETDVISWVNMATTVGCGRSYQYLVEQGPDLSRIEISPDFTSFEDSALNAILTGQEITHFPAGAREWNPGPQSPLGDEGKPRIFMFDRKPYILGRAGYGGAAVISVWDGEEKTWCEYSYPALPVSSSISLNPIESPSIE